MKKTLCAIALSLSLSHAGASDVQAHEQFEKEIKSTLAHLSGKSIAGLKVIYLGADMAPWLDTGMNIQPGEQVSVLLNGKVWLSRHYDISLEAPIQVGRRIGPEQAHRVGIERRDDDGAAFGPRPVYRAADHRLMPAVKAIEIAERHDAPAQMRRYRPGIVQAHHMARL